MRLARAGAVVALVLALAACGGSSTRAKRRAAVDAYFAQVDRAEKTLVAQTAAFDAALRSFSFKANPPAEVRALQRAQTELARVDERVKALQPPPDARPVHADIVRLLDVEKGLADDLVAAAHYVPRLQAALKPLTAAGVRLSRQLRTAKGWQADAAAFAEYRVALGAILAQLEGLTAPPELRPSLDRQRQALSRSASLCATIEAALSMHDARRANAGIQALFHIASGPAAARARQAGAAATRAYDARVASISTLVVKIARERQALQRALG